MSGIAALFWDVGGVILTNGWDTPSRKEAAAKFDLDWDDFEKRHHPANEAFETGNVSLDEYLARAVFYRPRAFSADDFKKFMFSESRKLPESYEFVKQFASRRTLSDGGDQQRRRRSQRVSHRAI